MDDALVGPAHARPAGHLGVAPDKGDTSVPCQAGVCDHAQDARGGRYDAGDHGKHVVNGGISTWLVVNSFEAEAGGDGEAALGDSTLRVPEKPWSTWEDGFSGEPPSNRNVASVRRADSSY
ncbi:glycoside hydrolase family 9 protein [Streptomyces sp. R-07]|uniref:glycoside hydrolase family 9 protein n=1 Tax=Streptomyces sp. R-07 TaxID=3404052 RepID=UPI003CF0AF35